MIATPLCSQFQGCRKRAVVTTVNLVVMLFSSLNLVWAAAPARASESPRDFTILAPQFGSTQTGQVDVKVQYITENETPTVDVRLNGRTISRERFTKSCQGGTCTLTGKLTIWDGMRVGENQLSAALTGRLLRPTSATASSSTPVLLRRTRFDFLQSGLLTSGGYNTVNYYTPVSLGLSTLPNGGGPSGNPWMQITTGYPADFNNVADAYAFPNLPGIDPNTGKPITLTTVTIPYPDVSEGFTCGGAAFQAYVLGRQNPYQGGPNDQYVETGACFNTISEFQLSFQNKMGRSLGNEDLVIMGTAPGQTVPAGFDASPLGGTNYSSYSAADYPQAYIMIGVPGAAAGSAYESFSVAPTASHPTSYTPTLNGTLMQDQYLNYNFISSGDTAFQVHSDMNTGSSFITIGNNTYNPPSSNGNNFWLLVLDRETLSPVNYYNSPDSSQNCSANVATQSCGAVYTVDSDLGARLGTELSGLSDHDLIFLVSGGCPVQNNSQMGSWFYAAVQRIGGAPYALEYAGATDHPQNYCNYSLVTANDGKHLHPLTDPLALSAGGAFTFNGQYGSLQGFLARNQLGLYDVASNAQMVPNSDGNGLTAPIDFTFDQVASGQRQDWPLVDTAFPIEAYADISNQILTDPSLGYTGSRLYDVRYFYTNTAFLTAGLSTLIDLRLADGALNQVTKSSWDNASPDQFTAARHQLAAELQQAKNSYGYLNQVENQMASSTSPIYADMIGMAGTISTDYAQTSSATANTRLSGVFNLVGGVVGLGSVIPAIGPILGVIGGSLRVGSAAIALSSNSNVIPSPAVVFDDTLKNIAADAHNHVTNLESGFDAAVDNTLSDAGKLAILGGLTSDTDSNWNFPSLTALAGLPDLFKDSTARGIWLDILPQLYGIRTFWAGPSSNAADYGFNPETDGSSCTATYPNVNSAVYGSYLSVPQPSHPPGYDLFVFAEGPAPKYKIGYNDQAVSVSLAQLLTTQGGGSSNYLNLPAMLLYAYSNMTYSAMPGPPNAEGGPAYYCPQ